MKNVFLSFYCNIVCKNIVCDVGLKALLRRAFYACVFKEITLIDSNQGNYFENATACSKTLVATQLKEMLRKEGNKDQFRNN